MSHSIAGRSVARLSRLAFAAGVAVGILGCGSTPSASMMDVVVRDADSGMGLDGVRIFQWSPSSERCRPLASTADDGSSSIDVTAGDSAWILVRDGYQPARVEVAVDGNLDGVVTDVALMPLSFRSIRIAVVDAATGAPVRGAEVVGTCRFPVADGCDVASLEDALRSGTRTGDDGAAYVSVPDGAVCSISIVAEGRAPGSLMLDPASSEGLASRVTVPMTAYRYEPTRVVVLDRNTGLPVEGAVVRVGMLDAATGEHRHESIWTTDAEGIALVMKPGGGLGTITIEHDGRLSGDFRVLEIHATDLPSIAIGGDDLD